MSAVFPLEETGQNASGMFDDAKVLAVQMAKFVFLIEPALKKQATVVRNILFTCPQL